MPEHFVCALDMYPQQHMLLAVGVCSDDGKKEPPCIAMFDQEKNWQRWCASQLAAVVWLGDSLICIVVCNLCNLLPGP